MIRAKTLLFLILLFSFSYSQFFDIELIQNYILPATIILVAALLAITWMASTLFNAPQLRAWVKTEIKELIAAGLVLLIVYSLFFGTNTLTQVLTGEENYQEYATNKLYEFRGEFIPVLQDLVVAQHHIGLLVGYTYSFPFPAYYVTFSTIQSPHTGAVPLSTMVSQANTTVINGIFLYSGIITMLSFLVSSVQYFLPIALALRFIPFTRRTGATLIALCIGAAIIFPTAVVVAAELHNQISISVPPLNTANIEFDLPIDFSEYCSASDALDDMIDALWPPSTDFFALDNSVPFGLAMLKIGEMIYALIKCAQCCTATPYTFVACYLAESMVIYNLIVTAYEVTIGAYFIGSNIASNVMSMYVVDAYNSLIPLFEGITKLMTLAIIDVLFIGIITVIGTKNLSQAFGGQPYLPLIERFLR